MKPLYFVALALVLLGCNQPTTAPPVDGKAVSKPAVGAGETATVPPVVDSSTNKADENRSDSHPLSPTDQGNSQRDLAITAEIRQRILRNKQVSSSGRNAGVITVDGHVTLRGPVASDAEHKMIVQIAGDVAGVDKVTDKLEVSP